LVRAVLVCALLLAHAVLLPGCRGDDRGREDEVIVSAASSLETAFTAYAEKADIEARQSFAGSDELAAQIRQGVRPDVYAAANTTLPRELHREGLLEKPVVFASNSLVLAAPAGAGIDALQDLTRPGTSIAVGAPSAPVGSYTRKVLDRLPPAERNAILANVRSEEPDVAGIVGKLTQGAVDAGFVYITDVLATRGELRTIELPARLQPDVAYGAAVVKGAEHSDRASEFIDGLLHGPGADALAKAGFKPPPG
jgi:molybdate transport system substrate-binding protein